MVGSGRGRSPVRVGGRLGHRLAGLGTEDARRRYLTVYDDMRSLIPELGQQRDTVDEVVKNGATGWPGEIGYRRVQANIAVQRDP